MIISGVEITHPQKIIYPKLNLTKGDLAKYYNQIADYILPYIENRLISLVRCPNGLNGKCFFQRHENIESEFIHRLKINKKDADYIYVKDASGLLTLIQLGTIEIHIWGSKIDAIKKPDFMVFDLDPDPEIPWSYVMEAAVDIKLRMDELGLESFLKTSGGKGLHVVIPIAPKYEWSVIKPFTKAFANQMASDRPDKYIANMSIGKRRGKIFIDYLRNDLTSTSIAPFCARAREDATISTPLFWEEFDLSLDPKNFTIQTIMGRLKKQKSDPWKNILNVKQSISGAVFKKFGVNV